MIVVALRKKAAVRCPDLRKDVAPVGEAVGRQFEHKRLRRLVFVDDALHRQPGDERHGDPQQVHGEDQAAGIVRQKTPRQTPRTRAAARRSS